MYTYLDEEQTISLWWIMKIITEVIEKDLYFDEEDREVAEKLKDFLKTSQCIEIREISQKELPF